MSSSSTIGTVVFALVLSIGVTAFVGSLAPNSRTASRLGGSELSLELPKDFKSPISFASGRDGEKDLMYISVDGSFKVKTYTDWGLMESSIVFVKKESK
jgi:hypothetical protein